MTPAERKSLVTDVQNRLNTALQSRGYEFAMKVLDWQCYEDEKHVYIPVAPGDGPFSAYQYVRVLHDVEYDMWDDGQESVMLVPARAD